MALCFVALTACSDGQASRASEPTYSYLEKMAVVFEGGHSVDAIRREMNRAFALYGIAPTEDNYGRYGNVLVWLRQKGGGETEMEILDYSIRSHVPGVNIELHQMMTLAAAALQAGDR